MSQAINPKVNSYPLLIREHHIDMLGHVNHATYLQLFEEARWEWIEGYGLGLGYVERTQFGPIILEAHAKYKKEVRLREKVLIESWAHPLRGKIFRIEQRLLNSKNETAVEISLVCGLMDLKDRKLLDLTPEWHALFEET